MSSATSTRSLPAEQRDNREGSGSEAATVAEAGHGSILDLPLHELCASPENDKLYRPVHADDEAVRELAASIRERGLLEPPVVTSGNYIVSGHRRRAGAKLAGLERVPCRVLDLRRDDDPDGFVKLLREHNRQRVKSRAERLREATVDADPKESYRALLDYRERQEHAGDDDAAGRVTIRGTLTRSRISDAKRPMLDAVQRVVRERRKYWPLSDRQIHYALLNDPLLRHASKPNSR